MKQQIAKMSDEQIKEAEERAVTGHLPKETAVEETAATTTEENPKRLQNSLQKNPRNRHQNRAQKKTRKKRQIRLRRNLRLRNPGAMWITLISPRTLPTSPCMYIRIYRDGEPIAIEDPIQFPMDPATPYLRQLFQIDQKASYFTTPYDQFYGILCYDSIRIILGPTFHMPPSRKKDPGIHVSAGRQAGLFFLLSGNFWPASHPCLWSCSSMSSV